jgi:SAM-dependent methyltransferase
MALVDAYAGLAGVYDELVADRSHGAWASFLDELWSDDADGVHDVLDVCCGTGLLAAELTSLGYRVVGVDASEAMLARARALLGSDAAVLRATLPDLPLAGRFDAAVCTQDGVNYLDPPGLRASFAALARRLRPAGWVVFDVHTDAMMRFIASQPLVGAEQDEHRFVIESAVDPSARTCDSRIEVTRVDTADAFAEHHRQHFHRPAEIRAALVAAGFEAISVRDGYTERPADAVTLTATWIARRAGAAAPVPS